MTPRLRICVLLAAAAACPKAFADEVTLECSGQLSRYSSDFATRLETIDPYTFTVSFDMSTRRLLSGPVADPRSFSLRENADSVEFFRDTVVSGRKARELLSINRVSGVLVQQILLQDPASGRPDAPTPLLSADCKRVTKLF